MDTPKALVRARRGTVWVWQDETSLSQRHPCKIQPKIKVIEIFPSETREHSSRVCHRWAFFKLFDKTLIIDYYKDTIEKEIILFV